MIENIKERIKLINLIKKELSKNKGKNTHQVDDYASMNQ